MRIRSVVSAISSAFVTLAAASARAAIDLAVVSAAPARPHFVAAGTATTFVISTRNASDLPATVMLKIEDLADAPSDWQARLFTADSLFRPFGDGSDQLAVTIPAGDTARVVARLEAGPSLSEGAEGSVVVSAWVQGTRQGGVPLTGRVRNRPKIYYVAIDGCGRGYLDLDRKGARFRGDSERLMPRACSFAAKGARMTAASSVLPAVTDPNHTAAVTGSWPGTAGIFKVRTHYMGEDAGGRPVMAETPGPCFGTGRRADRCRPYST